MIVQLMGREKKKTCFEIAKNQTKGKLWSMKIAKNVHLSLKSVMPRLVAFI